MKYKRIVGFIAAMTLASASFNVMYAKTKGTSECINDEILEDYMGESDFMAKNIKDNPRAVFAAYFDDATAAPIIGSAEVVGNPTFGNGADGTKALQLDGSETYLKIFDENGNSPFAGKNQAAISFKVKANKQTSWWLYSTQPNITPKWGTEKYFGVLDSGTALTVERYSNNGGRPENAWASANTEWKDVVIFVNENRTELYIDGKYVSGVNSEYKLSEILGNSPVTYIGYAPWGTGEYASGLIDNYEIYDTAPIVELGDITHLENNIDLPASWVDGCSIEWKSSDESVITSEGKITRPKYGKAAAVLTQKVTMGNISVTKDFEVAVYGSETPYDFEISVSPDKGVDIQENMYGLFFEDISYSADGGLYAEQIENRSFEQIWRNSTDTGTFGTYKKPEYAWNTSDGSLVFPTTESEGYTPLNNKNPTYLTFSGTKLSNKAYDGIYAKDGDVFNISFWAKSDSFKGSISAGIGNSTVTVTEKLSDKWTKYTAKLTIAENIRYTPFDIILSEYGTIDIDMISCIPDDAVYGIFRKDLAEQLKNLNPGFLRFPGGCIIEGYDLANRYQWKNSVGPIEERIQNWTRWSGGKHFDYNQSLGIGYYEYLLLCEYLDCEPIPVLNVGLSCEYNTPKEAVPVYASQVSGDVGVNVDGVTYSTEFYSYIHDALDLIEFCNGTDTNNEWVQLRIEMGHEKPFGLTMLGIGNEQWALAGNQWYERYEAFESVIHKYYPDMKLIGTSGPDAEGGYFDGAWSWIRGEQEKNNNFTYAVDEHYYRSTEWFLANTDRYDNYDRATKVFAGEYAANGDGSNTLRSAIAEAAFMTGLERNADVVYMASYAPLLCREGYECWAPNLIWFNDAVSYGKPDYYVQSMYMNNRGSYTLESKLNKLDSESYFHTVSYDTETGDIIIKAVNPSERAATVNVDLSQLCEKYSLIGKTDVITLTSENSYDTNTSENTDVVVPVTSSINNAKNVTYEMPPMSFLIFRVHTNKDTADTPNNGEKTGYVSVAKSTLGNPITGFDSDGNMLYAGDPAPMVDGDTVYLYVGNDVASGSTYSMPRWVAYSSKDLVSWKYEGTVMEENTSVIPWANSDTSAWASQAIKHNGKYYFYYCTTAKTDIANGHHCVGVAVADSPTGPFKDIGKPLVNGYELGIATGAEGWYNIDPTVWIDTDSDGNEHIYLNWGNTYNVTCELNSDMVSVKDINGDSEITKDDFVTSEFIGFEQNPPEEDYREAAWLYRRQYENGSYYGKYYMIFANGWRESLSYATSDDPMSGKWDYMGSFMPPNATSNTSHGGMFDFNGKTYFIYHNGSLPYGSGYRRVANIMEVNFNEDGTIDEFSELSTGISGWSTSIISSNGLYVGHEEFRNSKDDKEYPITKSLISGKSDGFNTLWELENGKADELRKDYISIQSVNKPGLYICESNGNVVLTQDADGGKAKNMTFITRDAINGDSGKVSFESVTKRGYYLSVSNGGVMLTNGADAESASFGFDNAKAEIKAVPLSDIPQNERNMSIDDNYTVMQEISSQKGFGIYTVTADFTINTKLTDTLTGYIAVYSADGTLLSVRKKDITPDGINNAELSLELQLKNPKEEVTAKTMLWNKKTMKPIAKGVERELKNSIDTGLINGDFEEELLGGGNWAFPQKGGWYSEAAAVAERTDEDVYSGGYSVKMSNATIGQRVHMEYGKTYTISAYIKGDNGTSIDILLGDGTKKWPASSVLASKTVELDGDWQEVVFEFDCEDTLDFVLCFSSWNDTVVFIDNVTTNVGSTAPILTAEINPDDGFTAKGVFEPNSGNPMMPGYIGDPFLFRDDDGTFYVYGTTDGYGTSETGDLANNAPYCVWYSKDLINWKCHTFRYEDGTFPKVSTTLWAPSVTKAADGRYYMAYIWEGYNCYIAVADSPLGPWTDLYNGEKLKGWFNDNEYTENLFDTDIITLSDGRTYIVTMGPQINGQNAVWLGLFKEDMSGLERFEEIYHTNVFEGPGLFERDGKYYLTFSNGSLGNGSYRVDYAMSDSLWSGYTPMGTILQRNDALSINTTGHSNSVCIDGEWYICYHRKTQVGSGGRSACIEKMSFNPDGTIQPIPATVNGTRPKIKNTITEKNLAWGGVYVTASSRGNVTPLGSGISWSPQYAVDRNNGTLWVAADTGEQWLQIDFGETKEVSRVETFFEYHTVAYQYVIEYSEDGENWNIFADKSENTDLTAPQIDVSKKPVSARYIKLKFKDGVDVQRKVPVGIFEVNVY